MLYNFCQEGKTFFAPNLKYVLAEVEVMDHDNEFDLLKEEILSKEKEIIEKYGFESDWGTQLGKNSLTSRSNNYNLLNFDNTKNLKEAIKNTHDFYLDIFSKKVGDDKYYVQAWANVLREDEQMSAHRHAGDPYSYLTGNFCLDVDGTSTYYIHPLTDEIHESENINGKMTIFPSFVKHYTDPVSKGNKNPRMTLAFDIVTEECYKEFVKLYPNSQLVELYGN